jgi:NADH:ubiquinone oxidoreductase subunit 5 (chain L)/Multisubunit Na+/H+ antiporter, MnhA subunit
VTEILPAEGVFSLLWVLIALPAAGALILLLGGRRTNTWGPYLGILTVAGSAVIAVLMLLAMMAEPAEQRTVIQSVYDWVFVGAFQVSFALQLDQLSIVFVLLITLVGSLIFVYSLGYMAHDPDRRKFFAYLNLFVAAMLLLVLANNYLLLYVGWKA